MWVNVRHLQFFTLFFDAPVLEFHALTIYVCVLFFYRMIFCRLARCLKKIHAADVVYSVLLYVPLEIASYQSIVYALSELVSDSCFG